MPPLRLDPRGIHLLLVDPDAPRRDGLATLLRASGYETLHFADGVDGCRLIPGRAPDLVLLDLDGSTVTPTALEEVRAAVGDPATPVVGLTRDASAEGRGRAVELGVDDVVVRPCVVGELRLRLENALSTRRLRRLLGERSTQLTEALRERTAETDTVRESLTVLAAMADYHDDDTDQHAQRVGSVSAEIATALGLPQPFVSMLRDAAPLHDIGKVGIARRILLKPGKLTAQEWMHMQQHVDIGAQILARTGSPVLVLAAEVARTHHERFDGSGYTAGLVGEQIPLSGRIVAVADVWDTLTHDRPYRPAWDAPRALAEIHSAAGSHFDPRIVEAFSAVVPGALAPAA